MAAATRARRCSPEARIVVVEQGPQVALSVCGLPYWLSGQVPRWQDLIAANPQHLREEQGLELLLEHRATTLDTGGKCLEVLDLRSGRPRQLRYDRLVVACGGRPNRAGLVGGQGDNVFSITNLGDAQRLDDFLRSRRPARALIVGGGYLGLEMCEALTRRGLKVTLLEATSSLLGLHSQLSQAVEHELSRHGVEVHTHTRVDGLEGTLGQPPARARTSCGQSFAADLFFLALGVSPEPGLLKAAGAALGSSGAVKVDRRAATSLASVFACGDCVEVEHRLPGRRAYLPLATTASRLGRVAGQNAAGQTQFFSGALGTVAVKVFELQAAVTGLSLGQAHAWDLTAETIEVATGAASSYYPDAGDSRLSLCVERDSGRILGGQVVANRGAAGRVNVLATAIEAGLRWSDLERLDLAYTPPLAPLWDPLFLAARSRHRHTQEKELMWEKGGSWV